MTSTLGLACYWGADRTRTWSGTPMALEAALARRVQVTDIDVTLPGAVGSTLRLAAARRHGGRWESKWRHGVVATELVERRLGSAVRRSECDVVLEIHDLGIVDRPFAVLQDLSYDLLLDHYGAGGVPHFRSLRQGRILALRDRQHAIYRAAQHLLPMSQWLADRSIRAGADPARTTVVHPGVNVPVDPAAPVPLRRTGPTRKLLFVGRDFDTKAGAQVVAAFRVLRRELGPRITLTVAGPKAWPLPTPPGDGIDYLGPVPASRVSQLMDAHDLFVMPSRFEGFGIVFIEALVRGLPCIGRNACAMPEIITPGDAGLLVDGDGANELADLIVRCLDDDKLYEQCALEAPRRRRFYTWERAADQIVAALAA